MLELYTLYSDGLKGYYELAKNTELQIDKETKEVAKYSEQQVNDQKEAAVTFM